ncbi:DNA cytosine methyltransferase [Methylosinus sp. H3A]|uniref:DNA cytosine methyltransferase n=1 Tax=Methylosinus sp. H3A TaxID=2785786 RepID=UPI0018C2D28B|nr:DNA cytosine methyltransferase [Methylosinus sp. H3A]MBG0809704.1 DNA cytosine methyltransferase [Methylosinus sp. H3A]
MEKPSYYEFFAGGGMARAGLGSGWRCLFANDFDLKKCETYRANWGGEELFPGDVRKVTTADLPGRADLVWASFPCQDLSLAGAGAGLKGERSGSFWPFFDIVKKLRKEGRHPPLLVLENVCGALTSHGGEDFTAICRALGGENYRFGALVIDAALFVPQSRPRLFIVALQGDIAPSSELTATEPSPLWHTRALTAAHERLPRALREKWIWWRLAAPAARNIGLAEVIDDAPQGVAWHKSEETRALLAKMSDVNRAKVEAAKASGRRMVGALYRRTRYGVGGEKIQRAEARFDDLAGCLRTPTGGSSRQFVLLVEKGRVRSRLISARETARLMGLPEDYLLPRNYNEAYHLTGDGVVAPVARHLAAQILEPLLEASRGLTRAAA